MLFSTAISLLKKNGVELNGPTKLAKLVYWYLCGRALERISD